MANENAVRIPNTIKWILLILLLVKQIGFDPFHIGGFIKIIQNPLAILFGVTESAVIWCLIILIFFEGLWGSIKDLGILLLNSFKSGTNILMSKRPGETEEEKRKRIEEEKNDVRIAFTFGVILLLIAIVRLTKSVGFLTAKQGFWWVDAILGGVFIFAALRSKGYVEEAWKKFSEKKHEEFKGKTYVDKMSGERITPNEKEIMESNIAIFLDLNSDLIHYVERLYNLLIKSPHLSEEIELLTKKIREGVENKIKKNLSKQIIKTIANEHEDDVVEKVLADLFTLALIERRERMY